MIAALELFGSWLLIGVLAAIVVAPMLRLEQKLEPFCVGCGCRPSEACVTADGPCDWAAIHPNGEYGICTACVAIPIRELAPRGELFA